MTTQKHPAFAYQALLEVFYNCMTICVSGAFVVAIMVPCKFFSGLAVIWHPRRFVTKILSGNVPGTSFDTGAYVKCIVHRSPRF
ncbi:hypothetical protein AGJ33_20025 [Cronobacter dublinensis subsp. dublinensis]|nr:hypothetical protein [Cronobacter dublinensis subsp. dublinensis]